MILNHRTHTHQCILKCLQTRLSIKEIIKSVSKITVIRRGLGDTLPSLWTPCVQSGTKCSVHGEAGRGGVYFNGKCGRSVTSTNPKAGSANRVRELTCSPTQRISLECVLHTQHEPPGWRVGAGWLSLLESWLRGTRQQSLLCLCFVLIDWVSRIQTCH